MPAETRRNRHRDGGGRCRGQHRGADSENQRMQGDRRSGIRRKGKMAGGGAGIRQFHQL